MKTKIVNFRAKEELADLLKKKADELNITVSTLITQTLVKELVLNSEKN